MPPRLAVALAAALAFGTAVPSPLGAPFEPEAVVVRSCVSHPDVDAKAVTPPATVTSLLEERLDDPRLHGAGLGLSLWIEGWGEVEAVNPELRLRPASNQKILTAIGALEILGPDAELTTSVVTSAAIADGVLDGDLFLVGGGDPTLAGAGPHSLAELASLVRDAGITRIDGDVVADETRYDTLRRVNGWSEDIVPTWVGALSALMVDGNRYRSDPAFISDPAIANAGLFRAALEQAGISVRGTVGTGRAADDAISVATLRSAPIRQLIRPMLEDSDNTVAEMLVKEIGKVGRGVGSTASGMRVLADVARHLCLPRTVLQYDGSGLSHGNARSTRQWRQLLQAAQSAPWWSDLIGAFPVAGETGTLQYRFRDTAAAGNLRAKTGAIDGVRALSGVLTTAGGRRVFFSAVIDDDQPRTGMNAIDDLLIAVAADTS